MAQCAVVFHWPPSEMAGMELDELTDWARRARALVEQTNKGG
ncbi:MAG: GpE family phage tail protein [Pseudomonadota bacterium]